MGELALDFMRGPFAVALRRGDVPQMSSLLTDHHGGDHAKALASMAQLAVGLRRQNVATIGTHDAFVVRTSEGTIQQVVRGVRLSVASGDLYQPMQWNHSTEAMEILDPTSALATYQGLVKCNAVAGVAVQQPPWTKVDGEKRPNPYREHNENGELVRVVVTVNLVGPAPATGNPIPVQYTLDYDPRLDLLQSLVKLTTWTLDDCQSHVYMTTEDAWKTRLATMTNTGPRNTSNPGTWTWHRMHGPVGVAVWLGNKHVAKQYRTFVGVLKDAVKKCQTVATRNAMRAHPALGPYARTPIDSDMGATLPVVGWTSHERIDSYQRMLQQLAAGQPVENMLVVEHVYDPDNDEDAAPDEVAVRDEVDDAREELLVRNRLVEAIDERLKLVAHRVAADVGPRYRPSENTVEELQAVLGELNKALEPTAVEE